MILYISLPNTLLVLYTENGVITIAPPGAFWAIQKPIREVANYYISQGATVWGVES